MVLYFSGTGNSRYSAQRIADAQTLVDALLQRSNRFVGIGDHNDFAGVDMLKDVIEILLVPLENLIHIDGIVGGYIRIQCFHLPQKPPECVNIHPQGRGVVGDILKNQLVTEAGTVFFICFPQPLLITMRDVGTCFSPLSLVCFFTDMQILL